MSGWKASRPSRSGIRGIFDKTSGRGGPAGAGAAMVTMVYGWEWGGQLDKRVFILRVK